MSYVQSNGNKPTWNHLNKKPQFGGFQQPYSLDDLAEFSCLWSTFNSSSKRS